MADLGATPHAPACRVHGGGWIARPPKLTFATHHTPHTTTHHWQAQANRKRQRCLMLNPHSRRRAKRGGGYPKPYGFTNDRVLYVNWQIMVTILNTYVWFICSVSFEGFCNQWIKPCHRIPLACTSTRWVPVWERD